MLRDLNHLATTYALDGRPLPLVTPPSVRIGVRLGFFHPGDHEIGKLHRRDGHVLVLVHCTTPQRRHLASTRALLPEALGLSLRPRAAKVEQ